MYSNSLIIMMRWTHFRGTASFLKSARANSSTMKPVILAKKPDEMPGKNNEMSDNSELKASVTVEKSEPVRSNLIASAFAPLTDRNARKPNSVDDSISRATNAEEILNLVDICKLDRKQSLKIISILADWSATGEADMSVFDKDPRFMALCQILGRPYMPSSQRKINTNTDDLTMVLNIKNDEEAAKIVTTFTLQQMIKVLSSLAMKKRRTVPLLRTLAYSISQCPSKLDIKQGADILFALATLNYVDEVIIEKVCSNINECLLACKKTSVVGSISTSLGILRYKDNDLLDSLCEWTCNNLDICRNQDLHSVLFTLAHVNHFPSNPGKFFENIRKKLLDVEDSVSSRLDVVWALTSLNQATPKDYESVLNPTYIDKLKATFPEGIPLSNRKKLKNINGAAKLFEGYNGPLMEMNDATDTFSSRSKEKQLLVTSVFEALTNLLPSSVYLRTNINLNMGFCMEGECLVDSKMTPLPLVDRKTGEALTNTKKGIKIGIFVWDYHDHTKGRIGLCGVPALCQRLATQSGYKILSVSYLNFNPKDKLTQRVKYLEKQIKLLVNRN